MPCKKRMRYLKFLSLLLNPLTTTVLFAVEVIDRESNAVEGKHYKILSNTVTIKAGEMSTNVEVQGIYKNIGITDSLGFCFAACDSRNRTVEYVWK